MTAAGPYRVETYERLGSTNDEAMSRLKAGDPGGLFIVAREQTGGRGRQGRVWSSPPGNLYCSFALRTSASLSIAPQLGFVAGLALCEAVRSILAGDPRLKIKWPNDLLFDGAKLAGILLEGALLADGSTACVVGIGVNCRWHPEGLAYPATNLAAAGCADAAPEMVLAAVGATMHRNLDVWGEGAGFPAIREAWLMNAAGLGETIRVTTAQAVLEGRFEGIDATGRLLIDTPERRETVDAGDVFLSDLPQPAMQI